MTTTIQYALWEDLPDEVRSIFAAFSGNGDAADAASAEAFASVASAPLDAADAASRISAPLDAAASRQAGLLPPLDAAGKRLYELYFYGYNIPHEVGHILRSVADTRTDRQWDEEVSCNRFAVAFWRARGAVKLLGELGETLAACMTRLADPCPPGEDRADYFNRCYQKLADPPSYAHYQFSMVLSALAQPLSFDQALKTLYHHTAPSTARLPCLGDPRISPDLPAQTLSEICAALDAFGLPLPEVGLQRIYTPAIQRVVGLGG